MRYAPIAAAAVIGLAAGLPQSFAQESKTLTLKLADSGPVAVTDGGKRGPSAGDALTFNGRLSEGRFVATAVAVSKTSGLMTATFELPGRGTIAAQGRLTFTKADQGTLAVTGGTGEFAGAGGSIAVASDSKERITFTIRLP